jgi:hypothetical protein
MSDASSDHLEPMPAPERAASGADLIAAAERKKRRKAPEADAAPTPAPAKPATARRRKPRAAAEPDADPADAAGPGLVTRGVHAGMDGAQRLASTADVASRRMGPWGVAAASAAAAVLSLCVWAVAALPPAPPVAGIEITWLPGPRLPENDVKDWVRRFPLASQLPQANEWLLERLAGHLADQPPVAEVRLVRLAARERRDRQVRVVELTLRLREPVMPAYTRDERRVWVDSDGRVLPGTLPGPATRRPALRGIEAGANAIRHAVTVWQLLEDRVAPGLVTQLDLDAPLDDRGARGLVLTTRQGTRLIWGRPDDERFGLRPEDRARDLLHNLACQGDLARVDAINVRFGQSFSVPR